MGVADLNLKIHEQTEHTDEKYQIIYAEYSQMSA